MNILSALLRKPKTPAPYRAYTTVYDREVAGTDLDSVLGCLTPGQALAVDEMWTEFETGLSAWRTRMQVLALDTAAGIRASVPEAVCQDTVFTLLVDQSGSMKGQSMLLAAAAVDVARDFLVHLGCTVEILGFTTSSWKGGQSRQLWTSRGRPSRPGRLCDLLHIVYRPASDARAGSGSRNLRPMLRPDLLKENVDGEALEWAAGRLRVLPQTRKVLIVISDGAPVDDSTLSANDGFILERHLIEVIGQLRAEDAITLQAIGLGHDVARCYGQGPVVQTPDDLGEKLLGCIESLIPET